MRWQTFLPLAVFLMWPVTLPAQTYEIDKDLLEDLKEDLKAFRADGMGKMTGEPSPEVHTAEGVVKGDLFGIATFKASFNNDPYTFSGNAAGGACVRGSGTIVLTTRHGSTITMEQAGLSCDTSDDPSRITDTCAYLIVGGTGRFEGATGTGNVVTGFDKSQSVLHFDGNIVLVDKDAKPDQEDEKWKDEKSDEEYGNSHRSTDRDRHRDRD